MTIREGGGAEGGAEARAAIGEASLSASPRL